MRVEDCRRHSPHTLTPSHPHPPSQPPTTNPFLVMAQICVPLPPMDKPRAVDLEVTIDGVRQSYHYRVETLVWAEYEPLSKVNALQAFLERKDPEWQLASIGVPTDDSIPVLFRFRPRPLPTAATATYAYP